MVGPQQKRRKKGRTLQQRGPFESSSSVPPSRLSPHLSNIDKVQQLGHRSPVVSSAGSNDRRQQVRSGQAAGTVVATPGNNTVSDLTIGASDNFNAFRVNEKSSLESYKQTMGFKLKDDIFRKLKFVTGHSMMEFSMDPNSLCQYVCKEMHITGVQQGAFWTAVKDTVKRMIEKQRTNATSGCKRAFQGTF